MLLLCVPFLLGSTCKYRIILLMKTYVVWIYGYKPQVQMGVIIKTSYFYSFTIDSQFEFKKFNTLFWRHLPIKTRYKILPGFKVDSLIWRS